MEVQNETSYIIEEFYGTSFDLLNGDEVGKKLKEKYRIKEVLYKSSNSRIYLVEDRDKTEYIGKVLVEESLYKYIYNERDVLKKLEGSISPKLIEFFKEDEINPPILIMEYLKGTNPFREEGKIKSIKMLLETYEKLEEKGLFHGDIKVENTILIDNTIKLLDFGLTNISHKQIGTVRYMPPETIAEEIKNSKSDLYSLSLLIYEYLYSYPYEMERLTEEILNKRVDYKGNFYLDLLLLSNINKIPQYRFETMKDFSRMIKIYLFIKDINTVMDKESFVDLFKQSFSMEEYKNFYYSLYKSKREKTVFLEDEVEFLFDLYIKESNFRIRDSFEVFYDFLCEIYYDLDKEKLLKKLKEKINTYLDENIEKLDFELQKGEVESTIIDYYKKMILKGSREASYALSLYYKEKNIEKSIEILEDLAKIDYANSFYQLGIIYSKIFEKDYVKSFPYFLRGGELGHRGCQNQLGIIYRFGYGVEKNLDESFNWYLKSAKAGHVAAQNNLGFMYKNGYGVEKNYIEALNWYKASALNGNSSAQVNLAFMYREGLGIEKNYEEALKWYKKASENENLNGQVNLGKMYLEGLGTEKNFSLAFKLFKIGAKKNNPLGKTYLAYMYQHGLGIDKDEKYAKELYEETVKSGFNLAQFFYGKLLVEGEEKDYDLGVKYLKKSAKQKNTEAMLYLAKLYIEGKVLEKSFVKGKKWLESAVNEGDNKGLYELGRIYFEGKEVLQNYTKAFDYILKSSKLNNKEAQKLLSIMYKNGYGVKKDLGEGEMWANLSGLKDEEEIKEVEEIKEETNEKIGEKEEVQSEGEIEEKKREEKKSKFRRLFTK